MIKILKKLVMGMFCVSVVACSDAAKIDFKSLPLDSAIKEVHGDGSRKLAVFTDPNCPYCQTFDKQVLPHLKNITVYIFPYPLNGNSEMDVRKIWCANDRVVAWHDFVNAKKTAYTNMNCDTSAVYTGINFANNQLHLEGTPTFVLSDGSVKSGIGSSLLLMFK